MLWAGGGSHNVKGLGCSAGALQDAPGMIAVYDSKPQEARNSMQFQLGLTEGAGSRNEVARG